MLSLLSFRSCQLHVTNRAQRSEAIWPRPWSQSDRSASIITNLSQPPLGCLPLLQAGEIVVVLRHVGHDRAFIWVQACHVLRVQQLGNAELLLSHTEGKGEVM